MISEPFPIVTDYARVTMQFQVFEEDGHICCGLYKLNGTINLRPKAWLKAVRREMKRIEDIARHAGCNEMRMAGRDWSRIFPDFSPLPGAKNGLRKLIDG